MSIYQFSTRELVVVVSIAYSISMVAQREDESDREYVCVGMIDEITKRASMDRPDSRRHKVGYQRIRRGLMWISLVHVSVVSCFRLPPRSCTPSIVMLTTIIIVSTSLVGPIGTILRAKTSMLNGSYWSLSWQQHRHKFYIVQKINIRLTIDMTLVPPNMKS